MQSVVEPDGDATDPLLLGAGHFPESLLEVTLRIVAELVRAEKVALGLDEVVGPADDEQRAVLQGAQARVEGRVAATRVQDPAVLLLLLDRGGVRRVSPVTQIGWELGRSVQRRRSRTRCPGRRQRRVERRLERFRRVREGQRRHLVLRGVQVGRGGRVKSPGAQKRVSGTHLEGSRRTGTENRLLAGIRQDVVVKLCRVRRRLVQSADICVRVRVSLPVLWVTCAAHLQGSEWVTTLRGGARKRREAAKIRQRDCPYGSL